MPSGLTSMDNELSRVSLYCFIVLHSSGVFAVNEGCHVYRNGHMYILQYIAIYCNIYCIDVFIVMIRACANRCIV